ncbi:unnamed protein product [Heligmosomoides polygyrus]|uniref:Uncharacterized protein n=1 Tax=Heligmosomoides polygyrus TaxID=6339 RepID=A0A183GIR3_HELPZ|nr:unnamed protein product [Heligmosomoides polygyrus]
MTLIWIVSFKLSILTENGICCFCNFKSLICISPRPWCISDPSREHVRNQSLQNSFYIATNIPFVFVLFASQFIQIAIVIERCIANVYIKDYETGYKKLGPILLSAAVSFFNFDGPVLNARTLPTKNIVLVNVVIMVMLAINFTGLALTITLHFVGPKRRIR